MLRLMKMLLVSLLSFLWSMSALADVPAQPDETLFSSGMSQMSGFLIHWLQRLGANPEVAGLAAVAIVLVVIISLAIGTNWIAKRIVVKAIDQLAERTPWGWDNALSKNQVFARLSHLAPAAVINLMGRGLFQEYTVLSAIIQAGVMVYVVVVLVLVASAVINTIAIYLEHETAEEGIPVKGFAQAIKLVLFIVAAILVLSIVFGRSPLYFLSGLGALTAVLLLVFRDALLGLVAGIMISANKMVRVGDWIEMPSNGADGDVMDVSLTTVKVRNWDRTITTIPSYDLISKSFKNWRGMVENKGRRIKRPIYIDVQSIQFVDKAMLDRMLRIRCLRPYLEGKLREVLEANKGVEQDMDVLCNGRRLTNIGTFRAYCLAYLQSHPGVYQAELVMARQLDPGPHGLPLEIYAFSNDTGWVAYEGIQADIFDHLFAILGEFGLRPFQEPSGHDMRMIGGTTTASHKP